MHKWVVWMKSLPIFAYWVEKANVLLHPGNKFF